jgi:hypothetical protein
MAKKNPHAVALGRLGGSKSSPRKTAAARKNARRPRPGRRRPAGEALEKLSADLDRVIGGRAAGPH